MTFVGESIYRLFEGHPDQLVIGLRSHSASSHPRFEEGAALFETGVLLLRIDDLDGGSHGATCHEDKAAFLERLPPHRLFRRLSALDASSGEEATLAGSRYRDPTVGIGHQCVRARADDAGAIWKPRPEGRSGRRKISNFFRRRSHRILALFNEKQREQ